ncbi:hypothetical protein PybrP1_010095 [[Pythium] brassicae (nom. inval.)]|nr:hypothetical protein PybrP1_010095 [[Pythium] brassicae (nom. inval.)]
MHDGVARGPGVSSAIRFCALAGDVAFLEELGKDLFARMAQNPFRTAASYGFRPGRIVGARILMVLKLSSDLLLEDVALDLIQIRFRQPADRVAQLKVRVVEEDDDDDAKRDAADEQLEKKTLSVAIAVRNWLKTAQTFDVVIENASESVLAQGPASVTVQSGATRNYTHKFFSYTEGGADLVVRFTNPTSGEYLEYDVHVAVAKANEVETLHFHVPVRQSLKKLTAITGRPEGSYEVEYRLTLHSDTPTDALLTIAFADLGEYTYRLVLITQQAGVERVLHFEVPLGGAQMQSFPFTTFVDRATEMACSVREATSFSVPTTLRVDGAADWDGKSAAVQVKFEPEALGEVRDTLTVFSESVGEYKCSLHGVSMPSLPQGPFVFASTKELEFRNVFSTPMDFDVVTAKLFVSCPARKELPPWVYYLEATRQSS